MKPKKRLWRRIARVLAYTLLSIVTLVGILIGFLHTPWGKNVVRGRIEAKLAAKVNGTVTIGSLDYSFMLGDIRIGGLAIDDAAGRPAIRVDAIEIDLDRSSLLAKQPLIEDLAVRGLAVSVIKSADGRSNLTGLFKPSKTKSSLARIRVAQLAVDGGATITKPDGTTITIADLHLAGSVDARPVAQQLDAALAGIAAKVAIAKPGRPVKRVDVAVGTVTLARRATGVDVRVERVAAGPLAIETLAAHAGLVAGRLQGEQLVTLSHARIDHEKLADMLGRAVLRDDVAIDLTVTGPTDKLVLDGSIRTGATCLDLDGTADLAAARPSYALSIVGDDLTPTAVITRKRLPNVTSDVRIAVRGSGKKRGDLEAQLDMAIHTLGLELTGTGALALDQTVRGTFTLGGKPAEAIAALAAAGVALPPKVTAMRAQLPPRVDLAVSADGRLDGELAVTLAPTKLALAKGTLSLAGGALLEHKKLRTAHARVTLASLDLASLASLAGRKPKLDGSLSGTVDVTRDGMAKRADYELSIALAKPAVTIAARGNVDPTTANAHASITNRGGVVATVDAQLPLGKQAGKLGLRPTGAWKLGVELTRRPAMELASLLPERLRAKLPHGDVELHVALAGTPAQPTGTLSLAASDRGKHVDLRGTLASSAAGVTLAATTTMSLAHDPLAVIDATVAMPAPYATGKLDVKAMRAATTVDANIELPARTLASLSALRPKLARLDAKLGGKLAGHITAKGPLAQPALDAQLRWFGYRTAAGTVGETSIVAYGTPASLVAKVTHNDALALVAQIDRSIKDRIAIQASAHAADSPLLPLLPAFVAKKLGAHDPGRVRWEMYGSFALVRGAAGLALEDVDVTGSLDVEGASLAIPNSQRRWHGIGLKLAADPRGVRIVSSAHERDDENRDRRLEATGVLAFANRRPSKLDLSLVAHDWLLFGSSSASKLGPADAPRAAADFDIGVAVDLASPIIGVDATVRSLTLRAPERFDRGHYSEPMSDDIIYLERGARAGRLPVALAIAAAPPKQRRPMDIRIHIPSAIRLNQTPFDVMARGELTVSVRDTGVTTRGALTMERGTLSLFGREHELVDGSLSFSDEHPQGWLALTFERQLPAAVMRELSKPSAGRVARVSFAGAPTKPKTSLSGAANAALAEVMAMNAAGRGVYVTRPGMPASTTVQAPRGDQLTVMTFLASNLPHLMFLDRISAWSDPYASANSYGRIQHVEAERYTNGERARVRAVVRPPAPGRSGAELQYDRMLVHGDQAAVGVGVRAGDRGGGGVGVFLEWSSKD